MEFDNRDFHRDNDDDQFQQVWQGNKDKGVGTGVVLRAVGFGVHEMGEWEFLRVSD
jgi:hypothetical protein